MEVSVIQHELEHFGSFTIKEDLKQAEEIVNIC